MANLYWNLTEKGKELKTPITNILDKIYWTLENKGSPEVVEAFKKMSTYKHFSPAEERILLEILFAFSEFSLVLIKHHQLDFTGYWSVSLCNFQTVQCVSSREVIYISGVFTLELCMATQDNSLLQANQDQDQTSTSTSPPPSVSQQVRDPILTQIAIPDQTSTGTVTGPCENISDSVDSVDRSHNSPRQGP